MVVGVVCGGKGVVGFFQVSFWRCVVPVRPREQGSSKGSGPTPEQRASGNYRRKPKPPMDKKSKAAQARSMSRAVSDQITGVPGKGAVDARPKRGPKQPSQVQRSPEDQERLRKYFQANLERARRNTVVKPKQTQLTPAQREEMRQRREAAYRAAVARGAGKSAPGKERLPASLYPVGPPKPGWKREGGYIVRETEAEKEARLKQQKKMPAATPFGRPVEKPAPKPRKKAAPKSTSPLAKKGGADKSELLPNGRVPSSPKIENPKKKKKSGSGVIYPKAWGIPE